MRLTDHIVRERGPQLELVVQQHRLLLMERSEVAHVVELHHLLVLFIRWHILKGSSFGHFVLKR